MMPIILFSLNFLIFQENVVAKQKTKKKTAGVKAKIRENQKQNRSSYTILIPEEERG
jgi:hypothetical protein